MNVEKVIFQPSDWVPNNQKLPVLIYLAAFPGSASPDFEAVFAKNGWTGIWRNGVFDYQHYHSGAHEVLGVGQGSATLFIGGPDGRPIEVSKGDCLVLPEGTGHQNLGASSDFQIVGAYPKGQYADIQKSAATVEMWQTISSCQFRNRPPYLEWTETIWRPGNEIRCAEPRTIAASILSKDFGK